MTLRKPARRSAISLPMTLWIVAATGLVTLVPGCSGCRKSSTKTVADAKKKKDTEEEKKKKDFEFGAMATLPLETSAQRNLVKPGHYQACTQLMKANNYDFQGELLTASTDRFNVPLRIENTQYSMQSLRPAALPKGVQKEFETLFFVPSISQGSKIVNLRSNMRARRGREVSGVSDGTTLMPDFQYYLVVLASEPDAYAYLKTMDTVAPPSDEFAEQSPILYYRVSNPTIEQTVPVPGNPFAWTCIAYVIWDEVDPKKLAPDQQVALVDWLQWGGQLIISAPDSLDLLKGSFLEAYLPADKVKSVELPQPAFEELNNFWSKPVSRHMKPIPMALEVLAAQPMRGVELRLRDATDSTFVPNTGKLVAERRVGNGRVVVTGFPLTDSRVLRWRGFDGFANNCLFRLPARRFQASDSGAAVSSFAGALSRFNRDPRISSGLRYFTRDVSQPSTRRGRSQSKASSAEPRLESFSDLDRNRDDILDVSEIQEMPADYNRDGRVTRAEWLAYASRSTPSEVPELHQWRFAGYSQQPDVGVGGWNDAGGAAEAARMALREAAGISIPNASFVLRVLSVYLLILVPINWGFFRLIGRVEWAWVAAPLIAIVGAVAVVRLAQLDIGFARSRTEIAVLEVQSGYGRAHLTRYTALYTSLSAAYELQFADATALAQPFPTEIGENRSNEGPTLVTLHRDRQASLTGFQVASNTTGMVHSEQMFELDGVLELAGDNDQGWEIRNSTPFPLRDVGVMRNHQGTIEMAWVGELAAKASRPVVFVPSPDQATYCEQWATSPMTHSHDRQVQAMLRWDENSDAVLSLTELPVDHELRKDFEKWDLSPPDEGLAADELMRWCRASRAGTVSLGRLVDLISEKLQLLPGDAQLVGWTEQETPGAEIRPRASQEDVTTLVLAHLRRAPLHPPTTDENYKVEVADEVIRAENESLVGARYLPLTTQTRQRLGVPSDIGGVLVGEVLEDSSAARAGIQVDDVILEYNDKPVANIDQLRTAERESPPNGVVQIKFLRNGTTQIRRLPVIQ